MAAQRCLGDDDIQTIHTVLEIGSQHHIDHDGHNRNHSKDGEQQGGVLDKLEKQVYAGPVHFEMRQLRDVAYLFSFVVFVPFALPLLVGFCQLGLLRRGRQLVHLGAL